MSMYELPVNRTLFRADWRTVVQVAVLAEAIHIT